MSIPSSWRGFPFIAFYKSNMVVSVSHVELGEVLSVRQSIESLSNEWENVLVLKSSGVEHSVVNTKAEWTILLRNEESRGSYWRSWFTNEASFEVFVQVVPKSVTFSSWEGKEARSRDFFTFFDRNFVIPLLPCRKLIRNFFIETSLSKTSRKSWYSSGRPLQGYVSLVLPFCVGFGRGRLIVGSRISGDVQEFWNTKLENLNLFHRSFERVCCNHHNAWN